MAEFNNGSEVAGSNPVMETKILHSDRRELLQHVRKLMFLY